MMAQEETPPPRGTLSGATLQALEHALGDYARDGGNDSGVAAALGRMVTEARARGIPPEEIIVELKRLWNALPMPSTRRHSEEQSRLLQHVVTLCIKSYYR